MIDFIFNAISWFLLGIAQFFLWMAVAGFVIWLACIGFGTLMYLIFTAIFGG